MSGCAGNYLEIGIKRPGEVKIFVLHMWGGRRAIHSIMSGDECQWQATRSNSALIGLKQQVLLSVTQWENCA